MKKIKFILAVIFTIITLMLLSISSFSHSGSLDANGGHWNRKTGEYHFHQGLNTDKGYNSSSKQEYEPFVPPYTPPTNNPYRNRNINDEISTADKKVNVATTTFCVILSIPFAISFLYGFCVIIYDAILEKHLPKYNIEKFEQKLNSFMSYKNNVDEYEELCHAPDKYLQLPDGCEMGADNLPKEKDTIGWGNTFTVYQAPNGSKIHIKYGCCNAKQKHNIYSFHNLSDISLILCMKCASKYTPPDMSWCAKYLHITNLKNQYKNRLTQFPILYLNMCDYHKKCNSMFFRFVLLFCAKNKTKLVSLNTEFQKLSVFYKNYSASENDKTSFSKLQAIEFTKKFYQINN